MVTINRVANVVVGRVRPKTFRGARLLYLRTVGRKTGDERMTPLAFLDDGDGGWIVAASNGGNDWEPGWWLNLQAGCAGTVEVEGTPGRAGVVGAEVEEPERAEWWARLNAMLDYEAYQRKVRRRIAVVRLTPVD
jgi:deazaflavin-dependent oxidoreductase (nitroreductase family)